MASRIFASSSSACCARLRALSSALTRPTSMRVMRLSSSCESSPIATIPAMRAPPLRVCSGRRKAAACDLSCGEAFQASRADSAASSSSTASSQNIAAISGSKSAAGASSVGAGLRRGGGASCSDAGTSSPTGICRLTLLIWVISVASLMRRSRSSSARAMRARSVSCTTRKKPVPSSRYPATVSMAFMQSDSSAKSEPSSPTPLSYDLRNQWLMGSARRMPWRASAIVELPSSVWQAR